MHPLAEKQHLLIFFQSGQLYRSSLNDNFYVDTDVFIARRLQIFTVLALFVSKYFNAELLVLLVLDSKINTGCLGIYNQFFGYQ